MGRRRAATRIGRTALACLIGVCGAAAAQRLDVAALADLSLEELANIRVTSVSGYAEPLSEAPASVYVITADDIRRSGVTTLPEALRLAPNLQVARIDAAQYAISARGFNNATGNKLLVLVDGRTVYTPLFSGVFWDQQDLMLEDVERIEVISGPGATLWGLNAVNGVINVITRPAGETQGMLFSGHAGNREHGAALRFGGELGRGHYRAYAKARKHENTRFPSGAPHFDGREHVQAGFRADWTAADDRFTLQGDLYSAIAEDLGLEVGVPLGRQEFTGANLLGRWTRALEGGGDLRVQAYLDHAKREDRVLFQPDADIFDIEAQHAFPWGRHRIVWGGGYRYGRDKVVDAPLSGMRPMSEQLNWANVFAQGDFAVSDTLTFTPGIRVEENEYSGTEYLPSVRLAWQPGGERLVWAAVSRAVRSPSRFDRSVVVPILPGFSIGGPNFDSELADVYELGYRARAGHALTWSLTLFRHEWDRVRSGTGTLPLEIENKLQGPVYGAEGWATWVVSPTWRLSGGFTTLRKHLELEPGSTDPLGQNNVTLGNDPEFQWQLRSSADLGRRQSLDIFVRRIGALPVPLVEEYTALDVRYAWQASPRTELSVTVQNLQERWHPEFRTSGAAPAEIERSLLFGVRWQL